MRQEITITVEEDEDSDVLVAWNDPAGQGGIVTQGADLKELQEMVAEAVRCYFDEAESPARVRLHFITDPVLATA